MILKNSEKKENNWLEFQVESDNAEFEQAIRTAYQKNKGKINIPGFRRGKAPLAVIEGMYGREVFYQDALDELAQPAFDKGVEEGSINFIGMPSIVSADVSEERTAVYTFSVELYPEVELGQYKGLEVEKVPTEVSEEEVDREIEAVRKRNARKLSVEDRPAEKGDTANIDYEGFLDAEKTTPFEGGKGENHALELGSGSFVPGFEDQVVGMSVGEEKDISITFPEDYTKDLAGKDVVFHVKVNGITYPELPDLDDDFAQDVSEFDTFEEYKASIRKDLEERRAEQAKSAFRNAALEKACENLKADLPETMVRAHVESIIRNFANNYGINGQNMKIETLVSMLGIDEEAMKTAIRPNAERETKLELLINAIIDAEKFEATDEELDAYVEKISGSIGAPAEQIRKYFGKDYILSEFKKEKAMDLIADSAVAVDPAPKAAAEEPAAEPEKEEPEKAAKPGKKESKKAAKPEKKETEEVAE
ncbi:MAG: trigger factor [Oscillospiraceae bacterium]|nr:trigger factor [Oscillospiraceae bacterium]